MATMSPVTNCSVVRAGTVAAAVAISAALSPHAAAQNQLRIGILEPLSGPIAAGDTWTTRAALMIPPGTLPGSYRLVLGVYEPAGGARLALDDGRDTLDVVSVRIG